MAKMEKEKKMKIKLILIICILGLLLLGCKVGGCIRNVVFEDKCKEKGEIYLKKYIVPYNTYSCITEEGFIHYYYVNWDWDRVWFKYENGTWKDERYKRCG